MSSEKMTSILLHILSLYHGLYGVYENHAGCERGYFRTKNGKLIALPKKDKHGENLYLPDVVLFDEGTNYILLVEGKKLSTLANGIEEIKYYDSIENEFIKPAYPGAQILRCVSIFGGYKTGHLHNDVLIYMNNEGKIYLDIDDANLGRWMDASKHRSGAKAYNKLWQEALEAGKVNKTNAIEFAEEFMKLVYDMII